MPTSSFVEPIINEFAKDTYAIRWKPNEVKHTYTFNGERIGSVEFIVDLDGDNHLNFKNLNGYAIVDITGYQAITFKSRKGSNETTKCRTIGVEYFILLMMENSDWSFKQGNPYEDFITFKMEGQDKLEKSLSELKLPKLPMTKDLEDFCLRNDSIVENVEKLESILGKDPRCDQIMERHRKIKDTLESWKVWAKLMDMVKDEKELEEMIAFYRDNSFARISN